MEFFNVLFANHTTTGSIYQTIPYDLTLAKRARFYMDGPKAAGAAGSVTIWFEHSASAYGTYDNYTQVRIFPATAGSAVQITDKWTNTVNIGQSTMTSGTLNPDLLPFFLRAKYEISGVTASASAGTASAWLVLNRDDTA